MPTKPRKQPTATKQPAKKRGRPSKFTPAVALRITAGLSKGIPLTILCSKLNMPAIRTVYDWIDKDAEFSADIARARDAGWDTIAMDALRIADSPMLGLEKTEKEWGTEVKRGDMLGHRRLQVETRLKLLAKWDPKRYGDRVTQEISGPDGKPIRSETSHRISDELQDIILQRSAEAARIAANVEAPASFRGEEVD